MVGVEIHANAFETIAQGLFLTYAPPSAVLAFSLLVVAAIGLAYSRFTGRAANGLAAGILVVAHVTPYWFFTHRIDLLVLHTGVGRVAVADHRRRLPVTGRAPQPAQVRSRTRPLPPDHPLRHARNAHAAHRDPGLQRVDGPLRAAGREAQTDRRADQCGIQAPGPHDRDVSERGASFRRPDGAEEGNLLRRRADGRLRGARAAAGRAQADPHPDGSHAATTSCSPATAS